MIVTPQRTVAPDSDQLFDRGVDLPVIARHSLRADFRRLFNEHVPDAVLVFVEHRRDAFAHDFANRLLRRARREQIDNQAHTGLHRCARDILDRMGIKRQVLQIAPADDNYREPTPIARHLEVSPDASRIQSGDRDVGHDQLFAQHGGAVALSAPARAQDARCLGGIIHQWNGQRVG